MMKMLVFDMDGTIADLYNVDGWLSDLRSYNPRPYYEARPMYDMDTMKAVLEALKMLGWTVAVTSWLSKDSTPEYDRAVKRAKIQWLKQNGFPFDEINLVSYGTEKSNCTEMFGGHQILFDDNAEVRSTWRNGEAVDANKNILDFLLNLLDKEI